MAKQTAPAFPFAPDEVVEALESFAGYPNVQVKQGTRLRADNSIVRRWPEKFIRDGMSDDEKAHARQHIRPAPEMTQHEPIATRPQPLLDENAVLCIRQVFGSRDGDSHLGRALALPAGARLSKADPMVKAYPDHFVPVAPPGRTRENSVRALTDWSETRKDANGVYIGETNFNLRQRFGEFKHFTLFYKGQWVDRDSPIVRQHPASFQAII